MSDSRRSASAASGTSGTSARRTPRTIAAGSLKFVASPARRRCVIQTAPSTVARSMAPSRCAITSARFRPRKLRAQPALRVRVEQVHAGSAHLVLDARRAVRRADLAQHRRRSVGMPVDGAIPLAHQRPQAAARGRARRGERQRRLAPRQAFERQPQRDDRRLRDFVAIEAALGRVAHREFDARPDVAGVHVRVRLERGDAPRGFAVDDRPVERRRSAVADDPGMNDDAAMPAPDGIRDAPLQERRDDQLRAGERDGLLRHGVVDVELDR